MASTGKTPCSPNIVGKRRAGHGAFSEYKHRERRGLGHHMRLGKAADDPAVKGHCRASLLGLLANSPIGRFIDVKSCQAISCQYGK